VSGAVLKSQAKEGHYNRFGNSCIVCSGRAEKFAKGVRGIKKTKNGKRIAYRIRSYTDEEKKQMILDRLIQVKQNNL
jgi:hypothetical protein